MKSTEDNAPAPVSASTPRRMFSSLMHVGTAHVVGVGLSIVRNKLYALLLGPVGLGILSQLNAYLNLLSGAGLLNSSKGLVKYVSLFRAEGKKEELKALLSASFGFFTVLSVLLVIPGICFSSFVSSKVFGVDTLGAFIVLATLPLVFLVWKGILDAVVIGYKKTSALSLDRIIGGAVAVCVLVLLVYFWGLQGAAVGFLVTAIIALVSTTYFTRRAIHPEKLAGLVGSPGRSAGFRFILYFGLAGAIGALASNGSYLFVRRLVIDNMGLEGNGVLQAAWSISHQLVPMLTVSMSAYLYPRLCEISEPSEMGRETCVGLSFALSMVAPVVALVLVFRVEVIALLYSRDFVSASDALVWMMLAEFLGVGSWAFSNAMMAKGSLGILALLNLIAPTIFVACAWFTVRRFGFVGVGLSYCASNVALCVGSTVWAIMRAKIRVRWLLSYRSLSSTCLVAVAVFLCWLRFYEHVLVPAATVLWLALSVVLWKRESVQRAK